MIGQLTPKLIIHWPVLRLMLGWFVTILALYIQFVYCVNHANAQSGAQSFVFSAMLPVADNTNALAIGDLNGDGSLDLVIGNTGTSYLYFNDGAGNFVTGIVLGANMQTVDVAVGDLNDDGTLDLVVYTLAVQSQVYLNDGKGNFRLHTTFASALGPLDQIVLGDIDGDRDIDMIAGRELGNGSIYLNNGQGLFSEATMLRAGLNPLLIDQDGDGDLDLLLIHADTAQPTQSRLYLYKNNGVGNLQGTALNLSGSKGFENKFAVGDIDGDADLDYVVSSYTKASCSVTICEELRLLLNRGVLGFGAVRLDTAGVSDLTLVDLDHDRDLDIVSGSLPFNTQRADDRQSKVYLNGGTNELLLSASFTIQNIGAAEVTARAVEVADLDADGLLDLVLGNVGANAIYQNQHLLFEACRTDLLLLHPSSVADINGDAYLDIIQRNGTVRLNDGNGNFTQQLLLPVLLDLATYLAVADLNGDGRLDLVTGHPSRPSAIYLQTSNGQFVQGALLDQESAGATSLAIGDLNGDGTLDILIGRGTQPGSASSSPAINRIYFNNGAAQFLSARPLDSTADDTQAVALADLDADGDLDVVVGNSQETQGQEQGRQNLLYFNDGSGNFPEKRLFGSGFDRTRGLALGDINGDGQIDIVVGNKGQLNAVYYNDGNGHFDQAQPLGQIPDNTVNILLLNLDHDRDLDIIAANEQQADAVYLNDGQGHFTAVAAFGEPFIDARLLTVAAGDFDRDGDLDLVADPQQLSLVPYVAGCVMQGRLTQPLRASERLPQVIIRQPSNTVGAGPHASPLMFAQRTIPIPFMLYDPKGKPVDVRAYYSLDGGGQWLPALPTADTPVRQLATLQGAAPAQYTFNWDVYASNLLGQSDDVIVRLEVQPSAQAVRNSKPGPYRYPYAAAVSYPFRVRGTQVRVVNASGNPVAGAMIYRLAAGATGRADLFPVRNAIAPRTNRNGYLAGRGALAIGDQLVALAPISATHAFTLYHSSATPTFFGLNGFTVNAAGIQTLTVTSANPLTLFNLEIALEWDARNDGTFLADLTNAIQNSSDVLFDVTEGQVALGEVRIYQAKERWTSADVVIYASNRVHPRASMGGVVITPTHDIGITGVITTAYLPGQVRMGPLWDPFGQSEAELRQDWWLAFAHELAHYLLFLPDNYLGVAEHFLVKIDCQGSFMTNTYEEPYREFLTRDRWDAQDACRTKSIAAHTTGRTDWETIQRFLPWLHAPPAGDAVNPGPTILPLNVTKVHLLTPSGLPTSPVLSSRNFDLRDDNTGEVVQLRQAEAYLLKTQNTPQLEDDQVIVLGDTGAGSDRIKVRGAAVGDRICMIAGHDNPVRLGCQSVTANSTSLRLKPLPGWQPDIVVTPITSRTLAITVTQPLSPGVALHVQVLPAHGAPTQTASEPTSLLAPWAVLQPDNPNNPQHFTQIITLDAPAFEGIVRVWISGDALGREAMSQFFLNSGWGPNNRQGSGANQPVWGPNNRQGSGANNRAAGANHRFLGAPFASGDGKVTIFELENILGDSGAASLQRLTNLPNLPLWLTPVGAGYRFLRAESTQRTIAFNYLDRETPKGYEQTLTIYYLAADAIATGETTWQRLPTFLDIEENLAAARIPQNSINGQGIYALLATVEMPSLYPGWNLFAYVIPNERNPATAFASLAGAYTSVYAYDPTAPKPWQLYDATIDQQHPEFAGFVNDLATLKFGHAYWLYATQAITPYLAIGVPGVEQSTVAAMLDTGSELPPATFYGPFDPAGMISPTLGMTITAAVNDVFCGQGEVTAFNGQWVYKIQVIAAVQNNGCGTVGAVVQFGVGGRMILESGSWDNRQAQYLPITAGNKAWRINGVQTIPVAGATVHHSFLPLLYR